MSALPAKIGKYQITGIAGQGAMATVYVAYDPVIDRKVAIKVNKIPATLEKDLETRQQQKLFFNEAQTAGMLDHPNILRTTRITNRACVISRWSTWGKRAP